MFTEADISVFSQSIFLIAKSLSTPSLFSPSNLDARCPAWYLDAKAFQSRQAVTVLAAWLRSLREPLLPVDVQIWLANELQRCPVFSPEEYLNLLHQAVGQVNQSSMGILRPLLLFLQQYSLRQENYMIQLHELSSWLAPLLLPVMLDLCPDRFFLAVSLLISQAMKVFGLLGTRLSKPAQLPASAQHVQVSMPSTTTITTKPSFETSRVPETSVSCSLVEQVFASEELWQSDVRFDSRFRCLLSSATSCLFDDDTDAASNEVDTDLVEPEKNPLGVRLSIRSGDEESVDQCKQPLSRSISDPWVMPAILGSESRVSHTLTVPGFEGIAPSSAQEGDLWCSVHVAVKQQENGLQGGLPHNMGLASEDVQNSGSPLKWESSDVPLACGLSYRADNYRALTQQQSMCSPCL